MRKPTLIAWRMHTWWAVERRKPLCGPNVRPFCCRPWLTHAIGGPKHCFGHSWAPKASCGSSGGLYHFRWRSPTDGSPSCSHNFQFTGSVGGPRKQMFSGTAGGWKSRNTISLARWQFWAKHTPTGCAYTMQMHRTELQPPSGLMPFNGPKSPIHDP